MQNDAKNKAEVFFLETEEYHCGRRGIPRKTT